MRLQAIKRPVAPSAGLFSLFGGFRFRNILMMNMSMRFAAHLAECKDGVWTQPEKGRSGYYCRRTSFDKGRSDDYIGFSPRTDDNCPVIQPGQTPNGYCSCMKIILDY
jgi:hypothetical protein